jgi:3-deoxy-D-manno-octulosonic-acid transferase
VHGPHVHNFTDVYASLDEVGGAVRIMDTGALAGQVLHWLTHASSARQAGRQALAVVTELGGAADRVMQALDPLLASASLAQGRATPNHPGRSRL